MAYMRLWHMIHNADMRNVDSRKAPISRGLVLLCGVAAIRVASKYSRYHPCVSHVGAHVGGSSLSVGAVPRYHSYLADSFSLVSTHSILVRTL